MILIQPLFLIPASSDIQIVATVTQVVQIIMAPEHPLANNELKAPRLSRLAHFNAQRK